MSDTQAAVSDIPNVVSDTQAAVSDTQAAVSGTHDAAPARTDRYAELIYFLRAVTTRIRQNGRRVVLARSKLIDFG